MHIIHPPSDLSNPKTAKIILTRGYVAIIDEIDCDLCELNWYAARTRKPYAIRKKNKVSILMHRVILERIIGREMTKDEQVDHIDGDGLNNRRSNLRLATHTQNMQNRKMSKVNKIGYKGVYLNRRGVYDARITCNRKRIFLGSFDTPEKAYNAYCKASEELHGEFGRIK